MPILPHMIIEKMELNMALGSGVDLSYQSMDWQPGWTKYRTEKRVRGALHLRTGGPEKLRFRRQSTA